jgi:hypothetical protein
VTRSFFNGENPLQAVLAIHDPQRVRTARQLVVPSQVAQCHLARHVLADAHDLEIHERADRPLRIGERRLQLRALLGVLGLDDVLHHVLGQVRSQVRDLVDVEVLRRGDDLGAVHVREQRVADRVGDFEEDFAVPVAADHSPDDEAVFEAQVLQDVRDIGGMKPVHQPLQGWQVARMREAAQCRLEVFLGRERASLLRRRHQGNSAAGMRARIIRVLRSSHAVDRCRS